MCSHAIVSVCSPSLSCCPSHRMRCLRRRQWWPYSCACCATHRSLPLLWELKAAAPWRPRTLQIAHRAVAHAQSFRERSRFPRFIRSGRAGGRYDALGVLCGLQRRRSGWCSPSRSLHGQAYPAPRALRASSPPLARVGGLRSCSQRGSDVHICKHMHMHMHTLFVACGAMFCTERNTCIERICLCHVSGGRYNVLDFIARLHLPRLQWLVQRVSARQCVSACVARLLLPPLIYISVRPRLMRGAAGNALILLAIAVLAVSNGVLATASMMHVAQLAPRALSEEAVYVAMAGVYFGLASGATLSFWLARDALRIGQISC